jgi:hypothetical protein
VAAGGGDHHAATGQNDGPRLSLRGASDVNVGMVPPSSAFAPRLFILGAAVLSLCLGACGAETQTPAPGAAASDADRTGLCDALCGLQTRCAGEDDGDAEVCTCHDEFPDAELLLQRAVQGLTECFSELACSDSDDQCSSDVLREIEPDLDSPLLQECVRVQDSCGGFSDDACAFAIAFNDAGRELLGRCFEADCADVAPCVLDLTGGSR